MGTVWLPFVSLVLSLTGSNGYFYEPGYDHYYTYSSKSNLLEMHDVTTIIKFRVRPINHTNDGSSIQQLHLDSFVQHSESGYMLENPMKWNLSKSFLFRVSPNGLVSNVHYHPNDDQEVVSLKKVLASTLSGRKLDVNHPSPVTYSEIDHAGHLDHVYRVHRKDEGFMVSRSHQSSDKVKRQHNKTLHYDHKGTVHYGEAEDSITLHNDTNKQAVRKPLPGETPIGDSSSGEFPTIASSSKSHVKLTLKRKHSDGEIHRIHDETELIEDTLLILMIEKEKKPLQEVNATINKLLECIHSYQNHYAPNRTDCVTQLNEILTNLQDDDYGLYAENEVTTLCKENDTVCAEQKKLFVDLVARKGDNFSQSLVVKHFLRNKEAIEDHVHRCLFHAIAIQKPTMELIEAVEDLCFGVNNELHRGEKLGKTQRRACLTLGALAKVIVDTHDHVAHRLVEKLETWLGYHNETHSKPIISRRKRSVKDVDPIRSNHVVTKMVLLHAIGNAGMVRSRDHILSYMQPNQGVLAWRRAAVHGLRHFSCHEDELSTNNGGYVLQNLNLEHQTDDEEDDRDEDVDDDNPESIHYISVDSDSIRKNLKGENVKVHIDNLVEPNISVQVRHLNAEHVKEMAERIKRSYDDYTVLIGVLDQDCELDRLKIPGQAKIQVLGGNHTRAALQLLKTEGSLTEEDKRLFVRMDIYHGLTNKQALHLAYNHNEIHENSRQMSFEDKVNFFHTVRERVITDNQNMNNRQIASIWRDEVATVTSRTKQEVKNSFRIHLFLASSDGKLWDALQEVFQASRTDNLKKGKKKGSVELTQYYFIKFSKIKTKEERLGLLEQLLSREISLDEFRELCSHSSESQTEKSSHSTKQQNLKKPESKQSKISDKREEVQCNKEYDDDLKKRLCLLQGELKSEKGRNSKLLKQIDQYKEQINEARNLQDQLIKKERMISLLGNKIEVQKQKINEYKACQEVLNRQIDNYKSEAMLAKEAAARARSTIIPAKQKNEHESTSAKCGVRTKQTEEDDSTPSVQKKQKVDEESVTAVLLEYNKGAVYLGIHRDNYIIFCQKPVGHLKDREFFCKPSKHSYTINKRDREDLDSIDRNYVIAEFQAKIANNSIISSSIPNLQQSVNEYLRK